MEKILDLFYPPVCMKCKNIFPYNSKERYICSQCFPAYVFVSGMQCNKCGVPIEKGEFCKNCRKRIHENNNGDGFFFVRNYPMFLYDGVIKSLIYEFKYGDNPSMSRGIGKLIGVWLEKNPDIFEDVDLIIPVPMFYRKKRKRGYNQAELIAKELSKLINVKQSDKIIRRTRNTKKQSGLNPMERQANVKNVFKVSKESLVKNKKILLVDDIYTTGNTMNECSKALMESGAGEVISFSLSVVENKVKNEEML